MENTKQNQVPTEDDNMSQESIEELLALASQSMDQLESELSDDQIEAPDHASIADQGSIADSEQLDSTLDDLERELGTLQQQIQQEEMIESGESSIAVDENQIALSESQLETEKIVPASDDRSEPLDSADVANVGVVEKEQNPDDILAELAFELEGLNKNLSQPKSSQKVQSSPEEILPDTGESIDDLLEQFGQNDSADEIDNQIEANVNEQAQDESLENLLEQIGQTKDDEIQADSISSSGDAIAQSGGQTEIIDQQETIDEVFLETESGADSSSENLPNKIDDLLMQLQEDSQYLDEGDLVTSDEADANEKVTADSQTESDQEILSDMQSVSMVEESNDNTSAKSDLESDNEENFVSDDLLTDIEPVTQEQENMPDLDELPELPSDTTSELSEEDRLVMAELEQAEQSRSETGEGESEKSGNQREKEQAYAHFNRPQQAVLKSLDMANRSLQFVPDETNDTLGVVAVVTLMISMVSTALFLLFK